MITMTYRDAIRSAMREAMQKDPRVFRVSPQQEECGTYTFTLQSIQDLRGCSGPGTIVEREHQLLGMQWQCYRKLFTADPRRALGVDLDRALSPERVRVARA